MGQIKTGTSNSEPHRVQAEYEPNSQAIMLLHEPTHESTITPMQNEVSVAPTNQLDSSANEVLPPPQIAQQQQQQQHQLQLQRQQLQSNQALGVPSPAAAPVMAAQFPPQSSQNTGVVYTTGLNQQHVEYYPTQSRQTIPMQAVPFSPRGLQVQTHVMMHSTEPNQRAIYQQQQQQGPYPQAIYQQPPPPLQPNYPQNIAQPFGCSSYASHSQSFHEATYQVPTQFVVPQPVEGWKTGLFDCMDDPMNALVTLCFPCVTFGQVAEIVDEGRTSCATGGLLYGLIAFLVGVPCILSCTYRTKLRNNFGIVESPAPDWVTHCIFDCCALCQEYRELQQRGWDPSIGWHANLAKRHSLQQQQNVVMMPPLNQTMTG